ncbi:copper-containing nitrite reductase [Halococcus morrhuae DSM 1307]|uniref:copper-containing nitrite reductase n=1 Tax=Halococcus morrhuae TaxID=2250 RepID=UPI003F831143
MFPISRRRLLGALGIGGAASVAGCTTGLQTEAVGQPSTTLQQAQQKAMERVAADPTDIPEPIDRTEPKHHEITLEAKEVTAEIEDGVTFNFMTFDGRVPGPMIRLREGDTVSFTMENLPENKREHNVDMHAIYGTGGGSVATTAEPGTANGMRFEATYPGAYIYHCAVPNMDQHISTGMFGMVLVEPKAGMPPVDREFYLGQHEVYTDKAVGEQGHHGFDADAMLNEAPTYVLFNGEKYPFTPDRYGTMSAETGETVRVFLVTGGPNVSSNFHPIGNVWTRAWRDGALASQPERYVQTMKVPPGSCMVGEMDLPVPSRIKLVDHALTRVTRRGLLAEIDVTGPERPEVFDPAPNKAKETDEEGPQY